MEVFNNTTNTVRDDLAKVLTSGSKVSAAAACFSLYAFQTLKEQLQTVDEFRFIFTSPTFITEKAPKEKREFYIPRLSREKSLYGTEFEVRLRNELSQKAIARECAAWMQKKAKFRSNITQNGMNNFLCVDSQTDHFTYMPMNSFTTVDLGCERGNNISNMVTRTAIKQQFKKTRSTTTSTSRNSRRSGAISTINMPTRWNLIVKN